MARFYSNENFPIQTVRALRRLGHDVLTSHDAGNANRSVPDEEVLQFLRRRLGEFSSRKTGSTFCGCTKGKQLLMPALSSAPTTRTSIAWQLGYLIKWRDGRFSTVCCSESTARIIDRTGIGLNTRRVLTININVPVISYGKSAGQEIGVFDGLPFRMVTPTRTLNRALRSRGPHLSTRLFSRAGFSRMWL